MLTLRIAVVLLFCLIFHFVASSGPKEEFKSPLSPAEWDILLSPPPPVEGTDI